jgi:dTDP-4-amino-4,6-dideoxygalactose transaminase
VKDLKMVLPENLNNSNFHLFVIKTKTRDALQSFLKTQGVPSLIHFPITIPDQPMFSDEYKNIEISMARKLVGEVLSLPCHPYMNEDEVDYVSNKIIEFFNK